MKKVSVVLLFILALFTRDNALAQTTSTAAPAVALFNRNLAFGLRNDQDVIALQKILAAEKLYTGPITGNFFQLTLQAVKKFQKKYRISRTGFVGPLTRKKLQKTTSNSPHEYCDASDAQESLNPNCICPPGAKKISGQVVCTTAPCSAEIHYSCAYSECKINSDCPPGKLCGGRGKCKTL